MVIPSQAVELGLGLRMPTRQLVYLQIVRWVSAPSPFLLETGLLGDSGVHVAHYLGCRQDRARYHHMQAAVSKQFFCFFKLDGFETYIGKEALDRRVGSAAIVGRLPIIPILAYLGQSSLDLWHILLR